MIKTWHKWFVCIFAVIFISVYLMFDAMFISGSKGVSVDAPTIDAEEEIPPAFGPIEIEDDKPQEEEKPVEVIPSYTNGYKCLNDAIDRFYSSNRYTYQFASTANSMGIIQNVKGSKQLSNSAFYGETFAFCDSSLGQTWYERITSSDCQTYEYIKTKNVNSNFEYNLDGVSPQTYSKQQLADMGSGKLEVFSIIPKKGVDRQAKFDRDSNSKYYIVSFVCDINKLPENYTGSIKNEAGASSVEFKSLKITYYISKTTGQIEKFEQEDIYNITIGITIGVTFKYVGKLTIN